MKRVMAIVTLFALVMPGCASNSSYKIGDMLPGKIISLSDGKILPMQIQLSSVRRPTAKMTASDPATGEQFDGNYTCIVESKVVQHSRPGFLGDQNTGQSLEVSNTCPCSAVLVGNKGTVLNTKMMITSGNPPLGTGDGEDNKGLKYAIQF
jgi:hypothetical protein